MKRVMSSSSYDYFPEDFVIRAETWNKLVHMLEDEGLEVDSAYRRSPEKYILAYYEGKCWMVEVTQYFRGDYEVRSDNIVLDRY